MEMSLKGMLLPVSQLAAVMIAEWIDFKLEQGR
jgi:hypothetical protein